MRFDIALHDFLKLFGNPVAFQRNRFFAVFINRRYRGFAGAGQADADIGVFAFARPVDHATHNRHFHGFNARILGAPYRHLIAQIALDVHRQFLEIIAGGATATGAGDNHRGE